MSYYTPPALLSALGLITYEPATGSGAFLINPPFAMTEPPPNTVHTLYHDRIVGLTVTAAQVPAGALAFTPSTWLVTFQCRQHNIGFPKIAAWLPSGRWDDNRWHPVGARLVPPAALQVVEEWLAERAAVGVVTP